MAEGYRRIADGFDVAVVGASVAGCTAARLFGQAGARVALIDRRPDTEAYKVTCTHAVLSSASPTIERLGLAPMLEARGAVRIRGDAWIPYGGWIRAPDDAPRGWGVTRRTLDPMLRALAADTPGVELMLGRSATRLLSGDDARVHGVEVATRDGRTNIIQAPLVVGADGRHSSVARLARVPGRVRSNNRFAYFAYWRGVRPQIDRARVWMLDPDAAAQFPNEDDLTVMVAVAHRSRLREFRSDLEGAYSRSIGGLADGPDLSHAERVSNLIGALDLVNVMRPAGGRGVAFVGDAAVATDPLWGVGVSWALQSAEWLVDHTAATLLHGGDLDAPLARYRRAIRSQLGIHHLFIADYSTGRSLHSWERTMLRAATCDSSLAHAFEEVVSRRRTPLRMFDPRLTPHLIAGLSRSRRPGQPPARS